LAVSVSFKGKAAPLLTDISFEVLPGKVTAVIGESGSGKTTLLRAMTKLFVRPAEFTFAGRVLLDSCDILQCTDDELKAIRRNSLRYVFQEPSLSFNPVMKIGSEFDLIRMHLLNPAMDKPSYRAFVDKLFSEVGIPDAARVLRSYPHQLSTGTLQRILIAIALLTKPKVILADEPTSSIDAVLRTQAMDLLSGVCRTEGRSLLFTTHDLAIARSYADTIVVLYAGRVVEIASKSDFFTMPLHPYSQSLVELFSGSAKQGRAHKTLEEPVTDSAKITGCKYHPFCPIAKDDCKALEPAMIELENQGEVRCPYWK
jgi:oligopeptide/dipeptide ABC transporter ATP-binding protein